MSTPPTAPITRIERDEKQRNKLRSDNQKAQVDNFLWQCCLNCDQWEKDKELCQKWNMKPPAKIIILGCEDWEVSIPF